MKQFADNADYYAAMRRLPKEEAKVEKDTLRGNPNGGSMRTSKCGGVMPVRKKPKTISRYKSEQHERASAKGYALFTLEINGAYSSEEGNIRMMGSAPPKLMAAIQDLIQRVERGEFREQDAAIPQEAKA